VRLGFRYVRGLRETAAKALVAARAEGAFGSPVDVAHRVPLDRAERETLASIGAFASLAGTRRQNMWAMAGRWSARSSRRLRQTGEPLARLTDVAPGMGGERCAHVCLASRPRCGR